MKVHNSKFKIRRSTKIPYLILKPLQIIMNGVSQLSLNRSLSIDSHLWFKLWFRNRFLQANQLCIGHQSFGIQTNSTAATLHLSIQAERERSARTARAVYVWSHSSDALGHSVRNRYRAAKALDYTSPRVYNASAHLQWPVLATACLLSSLPRYISYEDHARFFLCARYCCKA